MKCNRVRIWVPYRDSYVKVTLYPYKPIELYWGQPTEEGWEREYTHLEWLEEDGCIYRVLESEGCDCDGRLDHHVESTCHVFWNKPTLNEYINPEYPDVRFPWWEKKVASQRDYSAEAMNY